MYLLFIRTNRKKSGMEKKISQISRMPLIFLLSFYSAVTLHGKLIPCWLLFWMERGMMRLRTQFWIAHTSSPLTLSQMCRKGQCQSKAVGPSPSAHLVCWAVERWVKMWGKVGKEVLDRTRMKYCSGREWGKRRWVHSSSSQLVPESCVSPHGLAQVFSVPAQELTQCWLTPLWSHCTYLGKAMTVPFSQGSPALWMPW